MSNGEIDGSLKRSSGKTTSSSARRIGETIDDAEMSSRDVDPQSDDTGF